MTTIHFPRSLTEEEEILIKKYAKLRKKKKQLQVAKMAKSEPQVAKDIQPVPRSATDSAEIKEDIKKLVKAGAIKLDTDREKKAFKRKIKDNFDRTTERAQASSFHPIEGEEAQFGISPAKKIKSLSESFVPGSDSTSGSDVLEEGIQNDKHNDKKYGRPDSTRRGNTVCINAHGINEKLVRDSFSKYGEIINIKVETERKRCFLSFASNESAENAIKEMDCRLVSGAYLKVMLARRQPNFNVLIPHDSGSSKTVWGNLAANWTPKGDSGSHKDSREIKKYDEDDLF